MNRYALVSSETRTNNLLLFPKFGWQTVFEMLTTNTRIYDLLAATGLFEEKVLVATLEEARENGMPICQAVLENSDVKEEPLLMKLAEAMNLPFQRLKEVEVDTDILEKIPTKAIFQYNIIPLSQEDDCLKVATSDPFIPGLVDALRLAAEYRIRLVLSPTEDIETSAKKFYGVGAETLDRMMEDGALDFDDEEDLL